MSAGAVLDGGFELLRYRFGRIMALTACLYVPVWLLNVVLAVVSPPQTGGAGGSWFTWSALSTGTSSGWIYAVAALQLVALSVLGLCIGHVAVALAHGDDPSLRELGALALRRSWVALLIVPLNALVHGAGLCFFGLGWVLADALVFITSVTAGAERLGPWAAFRRGAQLTRPQYGRALLLSFGGLCIAQIIRWSLSVGPTVLLTSLDPTSPLVGLFTALSTAVLLLTEPLTACIAARAYLDLRCRRDGVDLVMRHERLLREHQGRHDSGSFGAVA